MNQTGRGNPIRPRRGAASSGSGRISCGPVSFGFLATASRKVNKTPRGRKASSLSRRWFSWAQSLTVYHSLSQKAGPTSVTVTVGLRPRATFVYTCSLDFPFLPKLLPQFPKQNLSSGIYVLSQVCLGERKWKRNLHNEKSPAQPTTRHYTDNKKKHLHRYE